jgi:hypothetical protein
MDGDFDYDACMSILPTKMAHMVFRTANKDDMVTCYKNFLGSHASHVNEPLSFITYDDEHPTNCYRSKDKSTCNLEVKSG